MVDDGVGKIMDTLRELGFDENTLVIYTSDQGSAYGQHGLWGNTSWSFPFTVYAVNMHIPLSGTVAVPRPSCWKSIMAVTISSGTAFRSCSRRR